MNEALKQAQFAFEDGEIPVGAVVVSKNKIIGKAYNQTELLNDVTAHAEMLAIRQAGQKLANYRLLDCTLYVTLEPCRERSSGAPSCSTMRLYSASTSSV
mgnify:CR=1 FL=1